MLTSFFKVEGVLITILFKNSSEFQRVHRCSDVGVQISLSSTEDDLRESL